ncbi:MAG: hypothetical protein GXO63_00515 [Candidatus Micrarchaeota archaeon]|nr:hypothetical protein [Candidatus Micrarchaeota archaeon]
MKKFKLIKQNTCETCLPICLLALLSSERKNINFEKEELKILVEGLKFTKLDYAIGQVAYVVKKYGIQSNVFIEFKNFFNQLNKLKLPKGLELINEKINAKLLKTLLNRSFIIVYIDQFYIGHVYHFPHFIILISFGNDFVKLYDPWDGKIKMVQKSRFMKGIQSLRNKWKISPKIIQLFTR